MNENYDLDVCINEADSFLWVARKIENSDVFLCGGMYPFTVNIAFACELYMKAILIDDSTGDTIIRGHKLDELFDVLPTDAKVQIEAMYSDQHKRDFKSLLSEISNAFIDWRYAFEKGVHINVTGILAFANALEDYVHNQLKR